VWNVFTAGHVNLYRFSGGRMGRTMGGVPILLLDHVGRKSGKKRTLPLMYAPDGDDLVLIASYGGARKHPAWFLNLSANPETTVQVGGERRRVRAQEVPEGEERDRLWKKAAAAYPAYDTYQRRTDRRIPVVKLVRA
jgi:deazaflavin-dependent oxidoreductase (nitroreductase family)